MSTTVINYTIEILSNYLEVFLVLYFISRLLKPKFNEKKRYVLFGTSSIIIFAVSNLTQYINLEFSNNNYSSILDFVTIILYIFFSIIFTRNRLLLKILVPSIECSALILISICVNMLISKITNSFAYELLEIDSELRLFSIIVIKTIFFVVMLIFEKIFKPTDENLQDTESTILSVMILISLIITILIADLRIKFSEFSYANWICVIGVVSIIVINVFIVSATRLIIKKNHEIIELSMYKNNFENNKKLYNSVKNIYSELKIVQHDEKNMLLPLYGYLEANKIEDAIKYLNKIENESISKFVFYVNTGIEELDTILNVKLNIARSKNIDVICSIQNIFDSFNINDIICLLSNALDNAIESSEKELDKRIELNIYKSKSYLCISISNNISASVLKNNKILQTTKTKNKINHGYGLKSIKNIVEKYNGYYECYEYGKMFVLDSFLMLK